MKLLQLLFVLLLSGAAVIAQDIKAIEGNLKLAKPDTIMGWKKEILLGTTASQTALSNWAAGGQSSFGLSSLISAKIRYNTQKTSWENTLDIGYGFLSQEGVKYTKKTDDKIDFMSKYGRRLAKKFYYTVLVNFKTQISTGYKYPTDSTRIKISNTMAPAYLISAIGMDYKPNSHVSVFAAPLTGKITFVNDTALSNAGAFGVKPGECRKDEFGGYLRFIFSKDKFKSELLKNVSITAKIDFFSNYLKDPQNIVVNAETLMAFKVNKLLSVNFATQLIYDDKVKIAKDDDGDGKIDSNGPRIQFKEILGVGISIKL